MKVVTRVYLDSPRAKKIPITEEDYRLWTRGVPIQKAAPYLSADDREFIISGITADEWEALFGDSDECEELIIVDYPVGKHPSDEPNDDVAF